MATTLPCPDGAGSLNNPDGSHAQVGTNNPDLVPYVAPKLPIGTWEISGLDQDLCSKGEFQNQQTYVAETLNISGAPINLYKLLGVHEQGNGSQLSNGKLISSPAYPGFPLSGVNTGMLSWNSVQMGNNVPGAAYIGVDFGIKLLANGQSEYDPHRQKWVKVGSINIIQANTPNEYARQVKVEISDGACEYGSASFTGLGSGTLTVSDLGVNVSQGVVRAIAVDSSSFTVLVTLADSTVISLGTAFVNQPFQSTYLSFTINSGASAFSAGDMFTLAVDYVWKRLGLFNLIQSPLVQTLNFKSVISLKALRVTPTLFTGAGSWSVLNLDVLDSVPTDVNNIQDLFFNENRDRDYSLEPVLLKAQYAPQDSMSDLSRFGLSILDSYSFTISYATMVSMMGRPIVVGDIVEVIPEMQYDHNLKPIRKFLEVTDTGWASEGFSTSWRPTVYRFAASQATPSQETRDIFGTIDTQQYLVADSVLSNDIGAQIDTTPLMQTEEIIRTAKDAVPEVGSDDGREFDAVKLPPVLPSSNKRGQPAPVPSNATPNIYIEDGLPKDGSSYTEGFSLPEATNATDGEYFRLNYAPNLNIPPRLYRFSMVKNKWLFLETDRRADYSSHKPSVRNILQSSNKQALNKKDL